VIALACIGEPVSWLKLERHAAGQSDAAIASHVAACPACKHCLDEIQSDIVALPPLAVPAPRRRSWWPRLVPAMALAAAAVIVLVLWRGRTEQTPVREDVVMVKGIGEVVLSVVRERGGVVRNDVRSFAPGDRWKVIVTCPPAASATVDVTVTEQGATRADRPLVPATIACGNAVVLPGAFTVTGRYPNRVCARVSSEQGESAEACLTITPE
jgi:hypothetical protein